MRLDNDDLPPEFRGLNPVFARHVWAKRKGWVPSPTVFAEVSPSKPKTDELRRERSVLARRSLRIRAETRALKFNPADVEKTAAAILVEVAEKYGVSKEQIRSGNKTKFLVAVRWQAIVRIYISKHWMSAPTIATICGCKDHTTVLNAVQRMGVHRPGGSRSALTPHQERKPE